MSHNHAHFRALATKAALSPSAHEQMAIVQQVNALADGEPILALLNCINDDAILLKAEQLKREHILRGLRSRIAEPFRIQNRKHIVLANTNSQFRYYLEVLKEIGEVTFEQKRSLKLITRPDLMRGLEGANIVFHLLPGFERAGFFKTPHFFYQCQRGALCFPQFLP